jgi:hypothetical protein
MPEKKEWYDYLEWSNAIKDVESYENEDEECDDDEEDDDDDAAASAYLTPGIAGCLPHAELLIFIDSQ